MAYGCIRGCGLLQKKDTKYSQQGEEAHGPNSRGCQTQASKNLLWKDSDRTHLIPPTTLWQHVKCCLPENLMGDSVPRDFTRNTGLFSLAQTPRRIAGVQHRKHCFDHKPPILVMEWQGISGLPSSQVPTMVSLANRPSKDTSLRSLQSLILSSRNANWQLK